MMAPTGARVVTGAGDEALKALPQIDLGGGSIAQLLTSARPQLEALLPVYLADQRWFAGKGRPLASVGIADAMSIMRSGSADPAPSHLLMLDVRYADGASELYAHGISATPLAAVIERTKMLQPLARVHATEGDFVVADAMGDPEFARGLVDVMRGQRQIAGASSSIVGEGGPALDDAVRSLDELGTEPLSLHSSNTSFTVREGTGPPSVLKLVRRHDGAIAPGSPSRALDVWKGAYLTNEAGYHNTPGVLGSIDHIATDGTPRTIATLTEFAANDGDSWTHALDQVADVLGAARRGDGASVEVGLAAYRQVARNHGQRLGELHAAFAAGGAGSEFRSVTASPEQLTARATQLRADADRAMAGLRDASIELPRGGTVDELERGVKRRIDELAARPPDGEGERLIHTHGDFHLGQMLKTGEDVMIVDLEGAPALSITQRWERASALGDVARQASSYEYAAEQGLRAAGAGEADLALLRPIADRWAGDARREFVEGWQTAVAGRDFAPSAATLPDALREAELSNALYETSYELGSRPDWVATPLSRLQRLAHS